MGNDCRAQADLGSARIVAMEANTNVQKIFRLGAGLKNQDQLGAVVAEKRAVAIARAVYPARPRYGWRNRVFLNLECRTPWRAQLRGK